MRRLVASLHPRSLLFVLTSAASIVLGQLQLAVHAAPPPPVHSDCCYPVGADCPDGGGTCTDNRECKNEYGNSYPGECEITV